MKLGLSSLCETLNQYNNIIIYGTGHYARDIYPQLQQEGLDEKIVCFTQTCECEGVLYDIPIINIKLLECNKVDCVVLIATSEIYVEEIKKTLLEKQYLNIVCLIDYIVDDKNEQKFYALNTYGEYCESIAVWYLKTHLDNVDKEVLVQELINRGRDVQNRKDSNLIVMICGHMSARSNKIISALKRKGYKIVMLYYHSNNNTWYIEEFKALNITIFKCQFIEEMLYKALQYNPLVYFFEPRWGDCLWAEIMLKNKRCFGKIVISLYDILNDGYFGQPQSKRDSEKYALENADGIVWKWFSKESLEKKGFHFEGKSILFLDYCDYLDGSDINLPNVDCDVLKLCMVMGVESLFCERRESKMDYISFANIGEVLEKIGNREDCIFHFYAGRIAEKRLKLCREYESQYKNFKVILNTDRKQLLKKLVNYDYACNLYTKGLMPPDDFIIDNMTGSGMRNHERNSFFDYLSAGLPIVATMPQRFLEYMQKHDVIVKMDTSNLDIEYLKANKYYYKEKARVARKELHIDNEIGRLIEFLHEVAYA